MVEIWEPEKPDERREIEGWDAPFDLVNETSPRVKLARRIARHVRGLIERGAAKSGDVLVLVRQRGPLFEAIIRALKHEGVAVAGADRLVLTEHIAVMDLMALADALLLPQDDLALATVLRSPLFGFSDDELFTIAWDRGRVSLRAALKQKAGEDKKFADAAARLDELAQDARRETPFAFYAKLLGAGGARKNFLGRLGVEANDALDEFLNLALDYERRDTPSLQGFVAWLRDAQTEVKRDMEIARDEVRVMTVHGAKGLEAPIVILADTMTPPTGPKPPRLLELAGGAVIWAGRKEDDVPSVAAARDAAKSEAENEYRRLLYVAMTRAADRLIICGADGRTKRPERCWYDLVRGPLQEFLVEEDDSGEKVLRFRKTPTGAVAATAPAAAPEKIARREFPAWLRQPAPTETPRAVPLSPSSAFDEDISLIAPSAGSAADRQKALERGRLVHRLMQALPDIPAERRQDAAERYLANAATEFAPGGTDRDGETSARHPRRRKLCRDFCAGQPRRGADRRPHRARGARPNPRRRPGGPPRRHRRYSADRRLQDRPDRSGPARRDAPLRHPVGALSRGAGPGLSGQNRARGAAVHRWAEAHGIARHGDGCGVDQAFTARMTQGSRCGEAPLTPIGAVHRFIGQGLPILQKSPADSSKSEVFHGR